MALPPVEARGPSQLALRLRALRERQWPDIRLTQEVLARALGGDEPLSVATISSWESVNAQKVPPRHRLAAYAAFFATRRSIEGGTPRLLRDNELTADERAVRDQLNDELLKLRAVAVGAVGVPAPGAVDRMWRFPDDGIRVTLICAELPAAASIPYTDRSDPNYVELFRYADLDALVELHGHIRAENPAKLVVFRTTGTVVADDLSSHVVVLGGVAWNDITRRFAEQIDLPIEQIEQPDGPDIFRLRGEDQREFAPRIREGARGRELAEDVGLLVRAPNPINTQCTVTICNGVYTRGVYGAVRSLTDARLRDSNEAYLAERFGETPAFGLLMRVLVMNGEALTPDFKSPGTRLYEWPERVS